MLFSTVEHCKFFSSSILKNKKTWTNDRENETKTIVINEKDWTIINQKNINIT